MRINQAIIFTFLVGLPIVAFAQASAQSPSGSGKGVAKTIEGHCQVDYGHGTWLQHQIQTVYNFRTNIPGNIKLMSFDGHHKIDLPSSSIAYRADAIPDNEDDFLKCFSLSMAEIEHFSNFALVLFSKKDKKGIISYEGDSARAGVLESHSVEFDW